MALISINNKVKHYARKSKYIFARLYKEKSLNYLSNTFIIL